MQDSAAAAWFALPSHEWLLSALPCTGWAGAKATGPRPETRDQGVPMAILRELLAIGSSTLRGFVGLL